MYENLQNLLDQEVSAEIKLLNTILKDLMNGTLDINSDNDRYHIEYHYRRPVSIVVRATQRSDTPLIVAIQYGNEPVSKALVENGADVCKLGRISQTTPLIEAIKKGSTHTVDFLLKNGAELTIVSAFLPAIEQGNLDIFNMVLDVLVKKGANSLINSDLLCANTPLITAIQLGNRPDVIKALVKNGADVCKGGKDKTIPLIEAIKKESTEIVDFLLKNGAEATISSAFLPAIKQGNLDIFNMVLDVLVKKGANSEINSGLLSAPTYRTKNSDAIIKSFIAAGADVNYQNEDGPTLLEMYIVRSEVKMVETLLKAGANVNGTTSSGQSPLALAAHRRNLGIVLKLIEHGADVKLADKELQEFAACNVDLDFYLKFNKGKEEEQISGDGVQQGCSSIQSGLPGLNDGPD